VIFAHVDWNDTQMKVDVCDICFPAFDFCGINDVKINAFNHLVA